MTSNLVSTLKQFTGQYAPVVPQQQTGRFHRLDLSDRNASLADIDVKDPVALGAWVHSQVVGDGCQFAVGGYGEDRLIYRSDLFQSGSEPRTIHLGVDLWVPPGTPVSAPVDGGRMTGRR